MRKVLSFVLVLSLVLSSFSMAFAADSAAGLTDIAGNANEDAIQVAYDLDIVTGNPDGTFLPEKAVTRAEFAAMITRALAIPESALAGYATTSFKDTVGYGWAVPYLAFCQSKGIMLGDGNGNVMPGRTINMNEAVTMALRAIGYTANSAELVGAWPSNYVTIAQNNDLYDDVAKVTNVNKAMAAQIIYNLLTVQKVTVNADGDTYASWLDEDEEELANLLNTNLGCTEKEDVIIGDDYDYDNSIINITKMIGAFGTAYENDDEDLVAFIPDSTALTGSIDDGDFEVDDVAYEFDGVASFTTPAATFANTDYASTDEAIDADAIVAFAADNTDDGDTVTIYVDLSGKKIKDVYSVVAWKSDDNGLADSDVQDVITEDQELLDSEFALTDDDEIDMNSFQLVGVASLDKIAEDDVVYVYTDGDDIRKVAVGTETVEGIVEELDEDDAVVTIGGKEYDIAAIATSDAQALDVDDEGTFYLDANGEVYDFAGTSGTDTYAVIKAKNAGDSFDNLKLKLFTSEDSTGTYYLNDDADEIDWTTNTAVTLTATDASVLTVGNLIGYSLDSEGDIKAVDATAYDVDAAGAEFQSTKVLKVTTGSVTTGSFSIDPEAVVFTYDNAEGIDGGSYDVCDLSEVKKGSLDQGDIRFILNEDGDVAALLINEEDADVEDDAIYGVFNARTKKTVDGDPVYKFTGYVDGAAFSYLTEDDVNEGTHGDYSDLAEVFGVYAIILDASGTISKIDDLEDPWEKDSLSGTVADGTIDEDGLGSDNTVFTIGGSKFTADDEAVVYKFDDGEFTVSKLSSIDEGDDVILYDTKGDDADGIATVVIYEEN